MATDREYMLMMAAAAVVLVVVFLLSLFKVANYDVWWILADGRYIVENREIPVVDVFRFVSVEREFPWRNHLYLTGTVFYLIYLLGGFGALVVFKALVAAAAFVIFFRILVTIRRRGLLLALLLVILSAFAVRFRLVLRPDVFSFLFFITVYYLVTLLKVRGSSPLYLLPLIHLLWVNLHGGYFAGLVLLGSVVAVEWFKKAVEGIRGWQPAGTMAAGDIRRLTLYSVLSALMVVVNPFGLEAYSSFTGFMTS